jgi:hypothetical protein
MDGTYFVLTAIVGKMTLEEKAKIYGGIVFGVLPRYPRKRFLL